jgi:hypothetical protein
MADDSSLTGAFGQAAAPTSSAPLMGVPAEYQADLSKAMLKKALAQALLQKGMEQPQGQQLQGANGVPGLYVKSSPLQFLSGMASTLAGAKALGSANTDLTTISARMQGKENEILTQAQDQFSQGDVQGATHTLASNMQYPNVAKALQTMQEAQTRLRVVGQQQSGENQRALLGVASPMVTAQSAVDAANNTPLGNGMLRSVTNPNQPSPRLPNSQGAESPQPGAAAPAGGTPPSPGVSASPVAPQPGPASGAPLPPGPYNPNSGPGELENAPLKSYDPDLIQKKISWLISQKTDPKNQVPSTQESLDRVISQQQQDLAVAKYQQQQQPQTGTQNASLSQGNPTSEVPPTGQSASAVNLPPGYQAGTANGTGFTISPRGEIRDAGPTLAAKQTLAQTEASSALSRETLGDTYKQLQEKRPEMFTMANKMATAETAVKLLESGKVNWGANATERTNLQAFTTIFGHPPPANVAFSQAYYQALAPFLAGDIQEVAGSRRPQGEFNTAIQLALNPSTDIRAAVSALKNVVYAGQQEFTNYDKNVQNAHDFAASDKNRLIDPKSFEILRMGDWSQYAPRKAIPNERTPEQEATAANGGMPVGARQNVSGRQNTVHPSIDWTKYKGLTE